MCSIVLKTFDEACTATGYYTISTPYQYYTTQSRDSSSRSSSEIGRDSTNLTRCTSISYICVTNGLDPRDRPSCDRRAAAIGPHALGMWSRLKGALATCH